MAYRVGHGTSDLARRIGPRRGLIGLALLGGAIVGAIFVVRYLRSREAELAEEGLEAGDRRRRTFRRRRQNAASEFVDVR